MEKKALNDVVARRFLLGQLSPEEQDWIQELAFENPDSFAFIQAAQDDLIDDFLYDELSPDERERFQNYFLVQPGRRQDLRIARALQQYLERDEQSEIAVAPANLIVVQPPMSFLDWGRSLITTRGFVTAVLILAAAVSPLLVIRTLHRSETPPMQTKQQEAPPLLTPSSSPTATLVQPTPSPAHKDNQNRLSPPPRKPVEPIFAIVLVPGGPTRSEGVEKTVQLSESLSLELPLIEDTPYQSYEAVLQREGKAIQRWPNLQPKDLQAGRGIRINVPARLLEKQQSYRITLNGVTGNGNTQPIHNYYFKVSK
jgi:hypothetical protein